MAFVLISGVGQLTLLPGIDLVRGGQKLHAVLGLHGQDHALRKLLAELARLEIGNHNHLFSKKIVRREELGDSGHDLAQFAFAGIHADQEKTVGIRMLSTSLTVPTRRSSF